MTLTDLLSGDYQQLTYAVGDGVLAVLGYQNDVRVQIIDHMPTRTIFVLIVRHI
jgi:hypothetical protein